MQDRKLLPLILAGKIVEISNSGRLEIVEEKSKNGEKAIVAAERL